MVKEANFQVQETLQRGLRRDSRFSRNRMVLEKCQEVRPTEFGLKNRPSISGTFGAVSWPYPQLFKGRVHTLLAAETVIYTVASDWGTTAVTTYDAFDTTSEKAITAGGLWHFIDLGADWVLLNGSCMVFKNGDIVLVQDTVTVSTGCAFQGRLLLGGFDANDFWLEQWKGYFKHWYELYGEDGIQYQLTCRSNSVMYSKYGGDSMYWFLYPYEAIYSGVSGAYSVVNPYILELWKSGDMGIRPMSWQGDIKAMIPFKDSVIVYGEGNVSAMLPKTVGDIQTFETVELVDVGISHRGMAGGTGSRQVFVDETGYVRAIMPNLTVQNLGYQEYLSGMTGGQIVVTHDPIEDDFYISDADDCFILTPTGLGRSANPVASLVNGGGALYGTYVDNSPTYAEIVTSEFDLGERGVKQVHSVEVGTESTDTLQVQVYYRFDNSGAFSTTAWTTVRDNGKIEVVVDGIEFKLGLRIPVGETFVIDYILVNWRVQCKRNLSALLP